MELNRRATHNSTIIRQNNFTKTNEFKEATKIALTERLKILKETYQKFMHEHEIIVESVTDAADLPTQNDFLAEVEERYILTSTMLQTRINELAEKEEEDYVRAERQRTENDERAENANQSRAENLNQNQNQQQPANGENDNVQNLQNEPNPILQNQNVQNPNVQNQNAQGQQYVQNERVTEQRQMVPRQPSSDFHLERLKVGVFDGDAGKWCEWRAIYDSLVHNNTSLDETQKFQYLKKALTGQALQVLGGWHPIGQHYRAAYDCLVQANHNLYRIKMAYLDQLLRMPQYAMESYENLRAMIDTMNRAVCQLRDINSPVDAWDDFLSYILISRMPSRTKYEWEAHDEITEMPRLDQVLKYLNRRANGLLNLNSASSSSSGSFHHRTASVTSNTSNGNNSSSAGAVSRNNDAKQGLKCYHCGQSHPLSHCKDFERLTLNTRKARVRELDLCLNCFSPNHRAGSLSCKASACKRCNKGLNHNTLLCNIQNTGHRQVTRQSHALSVQQNQSQAQNRLQAQNQCQMAPPAVQQTMYTLPTTLPQSSVFYQPAIANTSKAGASANAAGNPDFH